MIKQAKRAVLRAIAIMMLGAGFHAAHAIEAGWVGDLPVPAEALIDTSSAVAFDSPSGRVVKFSFQTEFNAEEIDNFFSQTLSALGWQRTSSGYQRGQEMLAIVGTEKRANGDHVYLLTLMPVS